jgi:hypothetical protein
MTVHITQILNYGTRSILDIFKKTVFPLKGQAHEKVWDINPFK